MNYCKFWINFKQKAKGKKILEINQTNMEVENMAMYSPIHYKKEKENV